MMLNRRDFNLKIIIGKSESSLRMMLNRRDFNLIGLEIIMKHSLRMMLNNRPLNHNLCNKKIRSV